ncbi:MAG: hypothetical protein HC800_23705 [Phormidesmis sp. RL_2_1]|nr:hypothetical protein [Phormidesmis sp. RL_2_1]
MSDNKVSLGLAQAGHQVIVMCMGWALGSFSLLLLWGELFASTRPDWFPILANLLKIGAFLISAGLCWRNTKEPMMLSGKSVWQAIAVGMASHALGDITIVLWRSLWGMNSSVSLANVFYGASYIFLAIGLLQAVLPRQISLSGIQTIGIAITGVLGIVLACWLNFQSPNLAASSVAASPGEVTVVGDHHLGDIGVTSAEAIPAGNDQAPKLIQLVDQRLSRVTDKMGLLYVVGDCVLIVMAVALLIAFWGGTYSEAWKLVALAGLCLYVADMFLIYEVRQGNYLQGSLWEIFWILSALFFGLGASVERGVSIAMQQQRPRRRTL